MSWQIYIKLVTVDRLGFRHDCSEFMQALTLLSPWLEISRPAEQIMHIDATSDATASRIRHNELQSLPNPSNPTDEELYNLRLLASVCEEANNCAWQTTIWKCWGHLESNSSNFLWMHAEWGRTMRNSYSAKLNFMMNHFIGLQSIIKIASDLYAEASIWFVEHFVDQEDINWQAGWRLEVIVNESHLYLDFQITTFLVLKSFFPSQYPSLHGELSREAAKNHGCQLSWLLVIWTLS